MNFLTSYFLHAVRDTKFNTLIFLNSIQVRGQLLLN